MPAGGTSVAAANEEGPPEFRRAFLLSIARAERNNDSVMLGVELEVRVPEGSHLRRIQAFDLDFLADPKWRDLVAQLKPDPRHREPEDRHHGGADELHDELRRVAVEQPAHAVGAVLR